MQKGSRFHDNLLVETKPINKVWKKDFKYFNISTYLQRFKKNIALFLMQKTAKYQI